MYIPTTPLLGGGSGSGGVQFWTLLVLLFESVTGLPPWWTLSSSSSLSFGFFGWYTNAVVDPLACNGHVSLCNRSYADVVFAGAHNSYAFGNGISDNQYIDVNQALVQGVRLLQAQGHHYPSSNKTANPSGIALCHTSCYLEYGGTLEQWLGKARAWLDANPRQVLTLLVTNPDGVDVHDWQRGFLAAGFNASNVYTPPAAHIGRAQWPTLGALLDDGKQTVVMMDSYANFSRVPWIMEEFRNVWENPYDQLALPFNCSHDRGRRQDTLSLHNHVKDLASLGISYPDRAQLYDVNAATNNSNAIVPTVQRCSDENGVTPTFVLVDYFNIPNTNNIFTAVDLLNNVSTTPPSNPGKSAASRFDLHTAHATASFVALLLTLALLLQI